MPESGVNHKYFTQIPNIIDDLGLRMPAVRLYVHIKRVAGEDRLCWQEQKTLAKNCRITEKTIVKAKRELEKAGLIEIKLGKIGKHDGHVIKVVDIWKLNKDFYENKRTKCKVEKTSRSKRAIDSGVKETSHAVENSHSKNNHINNNPPNNNHNKFVLKIPGQVNNNITNNEHERTPEEVAVMQIYRAKPGEEINTRPRPVLNKSVSINTIKPRSKGKIHTPIIDYRETILGMSTEKAIEFWNSEGHPAITLYPGETCCGLDTLLSNPDVLERHLKAIRCWLDEKMNVRTS